MLQFTVWIFLSNFKQVWILSFPVADPGFPIGGVHLLGGCGPLMWALFGENVCKNKRIGSHRGWHAPSTPPLRSANVSILLLSYKSSSQGTKICQNDLNSGIGLNIHLYDFLSFLSFHTDLIFYGKNLLLMWTALHCKWKIQQSLFISTSAGCPKSRHGPGPHV